jgi:predicted N-acyltransferase
MNVSGQSIWLIKSYLKVKSESIWWTNKVSEQPPKWVAKTYASAEEIGKTAWDACAGSANPFGMFEFIDALEKSGSASAATGWLPQHIVLESEQGDIIAIAPAYINSHSQGEYDFDHSWADAYHRAGGEYYPKLQLSIPFTPATAPKLLVRDDQSPELAELLPQIAASASIELGCSSAHATFLTQEELSLFKKCEWLERNDQQFHWHNNDYNNFEDFLQSLSSRKRKAIKKERRAIADSDIEIRWKTGAEISEEDWDIFFAFYQDTGSRKWGSPYLNRTFFSLIGETMADRALLKFAYRDGKPIAGTQSFLGDDVLFGRYWGCNEHVPYLHFELCYYQAIDFAIANKLARVEAGAQGEHKLARGYAPQTTYSAHFFAHPGFREAIADYLTSEREHVAFDHQLLSKHTPYKKG